MACYKGWHGSYGPRHIAPVLPLLLASLTALPELPAYRHAAVKALTWSLATVSILVNGFGVFCYSQFRSDNPFTKIPKLLWPS